MLKLFGVVMIFSSALMTGINSVVKMKERVRLLRALEQLVRKMRCELSFSMPELICLFRDNSSGAAAGLTQWIADGIESGKTPLESVSAAFESENIKRLLNEDEREFLSGVFSSIGEGSERNAAELLESAEHRLEQLSGEAERFEKENAKPRLALAVYIGSAAAILFI